MGVLDTIAKVYRGLTNPVAAAVNVAGHFVSQYNQNKIADKQIAAQREENEKARAHNLMLAELQNKWNVEQWAKENEYNSPSAQMARYAAAGLNPNLIYGQSNTSAQLSGSLSSGAPASPADMSAYGRKGSPVGKALENLDPFMFEQYRGMKLDNDFKEREIEGRDLDLAFERFISNSSFDPHGIDLALQGQLSPKQRRYLLDLWRSTKDIDNVSADIKSKALDNYIKSSTLDDVVKKIQSETNISESNARYLAATFASRVMQVQQSAELSKLEKEFQANKNEWMDFDRFAPVVLKSAEILGDFVGLKNFIRALAGNKKPSFGKMQKTGENTFEWK